MKPELTEQEDRFVREVLEWDIRRRASEWFLYSLLLIVGGGVFVFVAVFTLQHLNDRTAMWVTLPGSLSAILFAVLYVSGERRIKERRLLASVLRKLGQAASGS